MTIADIGNRALVDPYDMASPVKLEDGVANHEVAIGGACADKDNDEDDCKCGDPVGGAPGHKPRDGRSAAGLVGPIIMNPQVKCPHLLQRMMNRMME